MCVRTHDHHCPWLGTCVGENNRVLFYWFLVFQHLELALFFLEGLKGISVMEPSVLLIMGLLFIAMFFIMVSVLLCFHTFLLLANLTTWEHSSWSNITYMKPFHREKGSPFGRSMSANVAMYCCGPQWVPERFRRYAALRRDEEGGAEWEVSERARRIACCGVAETRVERSAREHMCEALNLDQLGILAQQEWYHVYSDTCSVPLAAHRVEA
eukprot:CAMPEP_0183528592 /NCGR_PEP_ID=MMETSP0371-20130417/22823_1 /TAXON_ID=268820 /ORGANISM="Peridinium aciculiferum, Strain PAER-2" /LENGTH=211 /DNA_ID=CAMNT_0025728243 /DNA_START=38 /DNA_END=671 /DNA_ORIENTATION=+